MRVIAGRHASGRKPLLLLSLLTNLILLGSLGCWLAVGRGGGGIPGTGNVPSATRQSQPEGGGEACTPPRLDDGLLEAWGCKVLSQACFDQASIVLHSGEKTPGHSRFTGAPLFQQAGATAFILPGYSESLGDAHYVPPTWDLSIRGPTFLDPPDIWHPVFERCTSPLVFWVPFLSVFADTFMGAVLALDAMAAEGAFDGNITLTPVTLGMDVPAHYQLLLDALTQNRVRSLSELSSREHIHDGQPRCFERTVLCNLVHLYFQNENRTMAEALSPKTTGRRIVEHYQRRKEGGAKEGGAKEGGATFRLAFMPRLKLRSIINLHEVVEECRGWKPPLDSPFREVDCVLLPDGTPNNFADLLARLQHVHVLVNTHGSGNVYAFFMRNGSALVEILPWNMLRPCISEPYADVYFKDWIARDQSMHTGYFRLVADKDHLMPGEFERKGIGKSMLPQLGGYIAHHRDQDVRLHFHTLAKAVEKIALGQIESTPENEANRTFFMRREDRCTGSIDEEEDKAIASIEKIRKQIAAAEAPPESL